MSTKINPRATPETDILKEICSSRSLGTKALEPETFWQLLAEFPWREAAMVYWYRLQPVIDRKRAGQRYTYIDVWPLNDGESLDQERLVARFGEGKYRGRLSDKNRPGQHKEVANTIIEIHDPLHPAWIEDLRELVTEHSDNQAYIQARRAAGTKLPWDTDTTALEVDATVAGALARMNSELLEEMRRGREAPPQKDPFEIAEKMQSQGLGQVLALSKLQEKSGGSTEALIGLIGTILTTQSNLQQTMIKQAGANKGGIGELKELLEILTLLKGSESGAAGESPWASFFASLPDSLGAVSELVANVATLRTAAAGGGGVGVGGLPAVVHPSAGAGASDQSNEQGEKGSMNLAALISVGEKAVAAFQRGAGGAEFARAMSVYDRDTYAFLAALKQPEIMGVLQSQPAIWDKLKPQAPAVEQFIAEFLAAGDAGEEGADDSGLQAV